MGLEYKELSRELNSIQLWPRWHTNLFSWTIVLSPLHAWSPTIHWWTLDLILPLVLRFYSPKLKILILFPHSLTSSLLKPKSKWQRIIKTVSSKFIVTVILIDPPYELYKGGVSDLVKYNVNNLGIVDIVPRCYMNITHSFNHFLMGIVYLSQIGKNEYLFRVTV